MLRNTSIEIMRGEPCIFVSHDHGITVGPEFLEQKGNILHVVQLTMRSKLSVYDIRPPTTRDV